MMPGNGIFWASHRRACAYRRELKAVSFSEPAKGSASLTLGGTDFRNVVSDFLLEILLSATKSCYVVEIYFLWC